MHNPPHHGIEVPMLTQPQNPVTLARPFLPGLRPLHTVIEKHTPLHQHNASIKETPLKSLLRFPDTLPNFHFSNAPSLTRDAFKTLDEGGGRREERLDKQTPIRRLARPLKEPLRRLRPPVLNVVARKNPTPIVRTSSHAAPVPGEVETQRSRHPSTPGRICNPVASAPSSLKPLTFPTLHPPKIPQNLGLGLGPRRGEAATEPATPGRRLSGPELAWGRTDPHGW
ncbi:MAG: hypothetical protein M1827_001120 [Pycnora praestabilis]|nr:MAG: hypothetical protein M1827_001120 [Pycnora praestabilis]